MKTNIQKKRRSKKRKLLTFDEIYVRSESIRKTMACSLKRRYSNVESFSHDLVDEIITLTLIKVYNRYKEYKIDDRGIFSYYKKSLVLNAKKAFSATQASKRLINEFIDPTISVLKNKQTNNEVYIEAVDPSDIVKAIQNRDTLESIRNELSKISKEHVECFLMLYSGYSKADVSNHFKMTAFQFDVHFLRPMRELRGKFSFEENDVNFHSSIENNGIGNTRIKQENIVKYEKDLYIKRYFTELKPLSDGMVELKLVEVSRIKENKVINVIRKVVVDDSEKEQTLEMYRKLIKDYERSSDEISISDIKLRSKTHLKAFMECG